MWRLNSTSVVVCVGKLRFISHLLKMYNYPLRWGCAHAASTNSFFLSSLKKKPFYLPDPPLLQQMVLLHDLVVDCPLTSSHPMQGLCFGLDDNFRTLDCWCRGKKKLQVGVEDRVSKSFFFFRSLRPK